ncbi:Retrovirus-related Pol polyprotein from transposon [Smittium culicis]|uniref:Retrovirus-related Pol polyprotein from transposon n=1 Tax=Smittium culicis TaxID=133412 RepID=A0A1R1X2N4_9FUNG|nr:Retrovirus-related Pol polyprotein from transposon [Smittium culicis]
MGLLNLSVENPDVREVNRVSIKNAGVPPNLEEFSEDFSGKPNYSTFDMMSGYDQISLDLEPRDLFSLQTPLGLVRMTKLPMSWCNSVAVFQRLMNKVFFDYIPNCMGIFLDDGIIKGETTIGDHENIVVKGTDSFVDMKENLLPTEKEGIHK